MQIVARAVRGPSWLAWAGLVLAAFVATADPAVLAAGEDDDRCEHSDGRPAIGAVLPITAVPVSVALDDSRSAPPVVLAAALPPPAGDWHIVRPSFRPFRSPAPLVGVTPRAPPPPHLL